MFAQPQQDNSREVARVYVRPDTDASPAPAASAPAPAAPVASAPAPAASAPAASAAGSAPALASTHSARPAPAVMASPNTPAPAVAHRRDHPMVGHRLANGYMAIHAPGQPCSYCGDPEASWQPPQPDRQAGRPSGIARAARAFAAATAVLAASVLALAFAPGAGSASAATRAVTPATVSTAATWHKLALIDGWRPASIYYPGTGTPSWTVSRGVVYLSGSIAQPTGTSNEFAVLPLAARPAHTMYITVYTLGGTVGSITIYPDGRMAAYSTPPNNAQDYLSLAAISYPARFLAGRKLTLRNGWHSSQSAWNSGDPSYSVSRGVVYLSGSLHGGAGANRPFAVLPRGARPAQVMYISVYTYSGTTGLLQIDPDGTMYAYGGDAPIYTSLAGVSFAAASVRGHKLTLLNGWKSAQHLYGTGNPSYSIIRGVVYLSGSLYQPAGNSILFAVLPKAARPAHALFIKIMVEGSGNAGTLSIKPNGDMFAYSSPGSPAQQYSSLAALSYPLSS